MHDGEFLLRGTVIPLRRAIFVFAGGTSATFEEFSERGDRPFKNAKGPDFVSRLRGVLNVCGPNERSERALRRAIILWSAVKSRCEALQGGKSNHGLEITSSLVEAFLHAGRFRHGARSIGAVVEMCTVDRKCDGNGFEPLDETKLPKAHLLASHVDRGPLDRREVCGGIGLSAGAAQNSQSKYEKAWKAIATALWEQGATLVYGGNANEGGLTELLQKAAEQLPRGKLHDASDSAAPLLRWIDVSGESSVSPELERHVSIEQVPGEVDLDRRDLLRRVEAATSDPQIRQWLLASLRLHRSRRHMNDQCVVRIVIGGKCSGFSGHLPGVLEETLMALHSRKPVYVVGGFGGAAAAVGELLGLGRSPGRPTLADPFGNQGVPAQQSQDAEEALRGLSDLFQVDRDHPLPLTFCEAVDFVWRHSIGGDHWGT